jgi:putative DNA primase/helicase
MNLPQAYIEHGLVLVRIPKGGKGPTRSPGWNLLENCITTVAQLATLNGDGVGLAHAFVQPWPTASVDLDDLARAAPRLLENGVDVHALLAREDAVQIVSGRPNRAKLLYRLPDGVGPLPTRQYWMKDGHAALELRCAAAEDGKTMQDVLPPTIHPDTGQPYEWRGDWRRLPVLPPEILAFWRAEAQRGRPRGVARPRVIKPSNARAWRELESRVKSISPDDRCTWLKVVWAVARVTEQSQEGLALVQEWSAGSLNHNPRRDPRQIEKEYLEESAKDRANGVGWGTLVHLSDAAGWRDGRPELEIELVDGKLPQFVDQCVEVLAGAEVYQRSGQIVHVLRVDEAELSNTEEIRRDSDQLVIAPMGADALRVKLGRLVSIVRYKANGDKVFGDCPKEYATTIAGQGQWPGMPVLRGITDAPTLRADGSILQRPGYDPASRLLLNLEGKWPTIPEHPSKADAQIALALLLEPFGQMPFDGEAARSAFVAALLTHAVRQTLDAAPMFPFIAPTPGSGKGLLADSIAMIVGGRRAPKRTLPCGNDEEMRKVITASLIAGDRMLVLDNVPRGFAVESPALDQAITSGVWADRILGRSEQIELPFTLSVFLTGNNISFHADAVRRCCCVHLDPKHEHPEEREFEIPDLLGHLRDRRRELLVAVLTIQRAYKVAGERVTVKPLGSFELWSERVREAIVWLGQADPVETQQRLRGEDDGQEELREMLTELVGQFGVQDFGAATIVERLPNYPNLKRIFDRGWGTEPSAARVSALLRKHVGQVVGMGERGQWTLRGELNRVRVMRFRVEQRGGDGPM